MKSSLIWDCTGEKPPIGAVLRNKAPYIRHLEEQAGLNAGLPQLGIERPELVFLAALTFSAGLQLPWYAP